MNDRFRFRAWNEKERKFILDRSHPIGSDYFLALDTEGELLKIGIGDLNEEKQCSWGSVEEYQGIVEQCTGLKDENGRLIYEGDIVRIFYDHFNGTFTEKEVVGPVKWECGTWIVNNSLLNHSPEYDETHLESAAVEVIGNIHENADLLEEKMKKPIL